MYTFIRTHIFAPIYCYRVQTRPSLLIGNHLLEGKIAALPKPYGVPVRNGASWGGSNLDANADAMQVDSDAVDGPAASGEGWTIRGIVKKKIVFSKRPMPVMAKKLQSSS